VRVGLSRALGCDAGEVVEPMPCTRAVFCCLARARRRDVYCVCHVVFQTDGATPLFIASQNGHVECVRALLSGGAAINQAMVGCASSRARHVGVAGGVRSCVWDCRVFWNVTQERWLSPCHAHARCFVV
jgi:hypothetical protein